MEITTGLDFSAFNNSLVYDSDSSYVLILPLIPSGIVLDCGFGSTTINLSIVIESHNPILQAYLFIKLRLDVNPHNFRLNYIKSQGANKS